MIKNPSAMPFWALFEVDSACCIPFLYEPILTNCHHRQHFQTHMLPPMLILKVYISQKHPLLLLRRTRRRTARRGATLFKKKKWKSANQRTLVIYPWCERKRYFPIFIFATFCPVRAFQIDDEVRGPMRRRRRVTGEWANIRAAAPASNNHKCQCTYLSMMFCNLKLMNKMIVRASEHRVPCASVYISILHRTRHRHTETQQILKFNQILYMEIMRKKEQFSHLFF